MSLSRELINDSITFRAMSKLERARNLVEADGAAGYLKYKTGYDLADLINNHLSDEAKAEIEARMIVELEEVVK